MDIHNNFNVYIGIAVEDRALNSTILKVYLKELMPIVPESVKDDTASESFSIYDEVAGSTVSETVKVSNSFDAEYFGITTNRSFPPDVVKGEQVLVFRYADTDRYFWVSLGRNDNLRRGEILRLAVSDDMRNVKELNDDNTYLFEMNTRTKKTVTIKTSKSDGEKYSYRIQIDAKNNFLTISDDVDNTIIIESDISRVKLRNTNGTTVDLLKENMILAAPKRISIQCEDLVMNYGSCSSYGVGDTRSYRVGDSYDVLVGNKFEERIGIEKKEIAGDKIDVIKGSSMKHVKGGYHHVLLGESSMPDTYTVNLTQDNLNQYIGSMFVCEDECAMLTLAIIPYVIDTDVSLCEEFVLTETTASKFFNKNILVDGTTVLLTQDNFTSYIDKVITVLDTITLTEANAKDYIGYKINVSNVCINLSKDIADKYIGKTITICNPKAEFIISGDQIDYRSDSYTLTSLEKRIAALEAAIG